MSDSDESGGGQSPWGKTSTMASGVFLLLLVVAGLVIVVIKPGSSSSKPAPHHQKQVVVKATTTTSADTSSSTCSLPAGDQTVPSSRPPAGATWNQVGSMSVPQAPATYGPQHQVDGIHVCFAHSPTGALLAAMNFWGAETTTASTRTVFSQLVVDTPSSLLTSHKASLPIDKWLDGGTLNLAGYKFDSYTPTAAEIQVVTQSVSGGLTAFVMPLRWSGGDWKIVYLKTGWDSQQLSGSSVEAPYVRWSNF